MQDLKDAILAAFEIADAHQQAGNSSMQLVKLGLKNTAGHISADFSAQLAGKLGVGASSSSPGGRKSFAWTEPPLNRRAGGSKKSTVAAQPVETKIDAPTPKGTVTIEEEMALYEKLADLTPNKMITEYGDNLPGIAKQIGLEIMLHWNDTQLAANIRKTAKDKIAE